MLLSRQYLILLRVFQFEKLSWYRIFPYLMNSFGLGLMYINNDHHTLRMSAQLNKPEVSEKWLKP